MCESKKDLWPPVDVEWDNMTQEQKAKRDYWRMVAESEGDDWPMLPILNPDPNFKPDLRPGNLDLRVQPKPTLH